MIREEALKRLRYTKVDANENSEEIQKALFSLGYTWADGSTTIRYRAPYIYIYDNYLGCGDDGIWFAEHVNKKISVDDILFLKTDESLIWKNTLEVLPEPHTLLLVKAITAGGSIEYKVADLGYDNEFHDAYTNEELVVREWMYIPR